MNFLYVTHNNIVSCGLESKQIMILGAGDYGYFVGDFLEKYGFHEYAYCVDDKYYKEGMSFHNKRVYCLKDVSFDTVNLIFAIGAPKRLRDFMESAPCQEVYVIFDPFEFWHYDESFMASHSKELREAFALYADELSRETMRGYLLAKQTGDISEDLKNISDEKMYFNSLAQDVPDGYYVDCGTFDGENIDDYLAFVGNPRAKVMAFEPVKENFEKLERKYQNRRNVTVHRIGLWDSEGELYIKHDGYNAREAVLMEDTNGLEQNGNNMLPVTTLDNILGDKKIAFIKIMTEGNEFRVLRGAEGIIRRDHPIVAVVPFCDVESMYKMPIYLNSFGGYRLFLRHYECVSGRLVLYAIPDDNRL